MDETTSSTEETGRSMGSHWAIDGKGPHREFQYRRTIRAANHWQIVDLAKSNSSGET